MGKKIYAIIVAAGEGKRLGMNEEKALIPIRGKPIFLWSLEIFGGLDEINEIILVIGKGEEKYRNKLKETNINKEIKIVKGGARRQDSVYNGINFLNADEKDLILVHDAARPFVSAELIKDVIKELENNDVVIPVIESCETLKEVENNFVKKTLDRRKIKFAQTPQGFKFYCYKKAMSKLDIKGQEFTDEASIFELLNFRIKCIQGDRLNIKITYKEDLDLAEWIAARR